MNISDIQSIIRDFESSNLMTLELEMDNFKLKLSKHKHDNHTYGETTIPSISTESSETPVSKDDAVTTFVKAPLVGTFYSSDAPGKKPFVDVGDRVNEGDVLCIIEAMKIMNEITAPKTGVITEIHLKDGQAVGFDQVIMTLGDV
ncbi:MAG: acetyl-CoA carboxylase biotin carboxyl carrier protein [Acholeplasmataceae bacterium]|nr:acetyl-CoA carboxylase biotin carboxyl carrier protein [Acholeplasmataceae bacterium]